MKTFGDGFVVGFLLSFVIAFFIGASVDTPVNLGTEEEMSWLEGRETAVRYWEPGSQVYLEGERCLLVDGGQTSGFAGSFEGIELVFACGGNK